VSTIYLNELTHLSASSHPVAPCITIIQIPTPESEMPCYPFGGSQTSRRSWESNVIRERRYGMEADVSTYQWLDAIYPGIDELLWYQCCSPPTRQAKAQSSSLVWTTSTDQRYKFIPGNCPLHGDCRDTGTGVGHVPGTVLLRPSLEEAIAWRRC
jgi:hypothetical protein